MLLDEVRQQNPELSTYAAVAITVAEEGDRVRATSELTLPAKGPLVDAIRKGDAARDPAAYVSYLIGYVEVDQSYLAWGPPALASGKDGAHVIVTCPVADELLEGRPPQRMRRSLRMRVGSLRSAASTSR